MNRYHDRLSGMFTRAERLRLLERNPVQGIAQAKEAGGRIAWLTADEEATVRDQLRRASPLVRVQPPHRPAVVRQAALRWADVDLLTGVLTVGRPRTDACGGSPSTRSVATLLVDLGRSPDTAQRPPRDGLRRGLPDGFPRLRGGRGAGAGGAQATPGGRPAPRGVRVARQPPHVRQPPGDGRRGPPRPQMLAGGARRLWCSATRT